MQRWKIYCRVFKKYYNNSEPNSVKVGNLGHNRLCKMKPKLSLDILDKNIQMAAILDSSSNQKKSNDRMILAEAIITFVEKLEIQLGYDGGIK